MSSLASPSEPAHQAQRHIGGRRIALVGNPNTGKTTLFNRLCGVRSKTANFPGSTVDARVGACVLAGRRHEIVDLPGTYSLDLDLPESRLCRDCLDGRLAACAPDAVLVVLDATNLRRNLQFAASVLRRGNPAVIALNMVDLAARRGLSVDAARLEERLGVPVVAVSARSGLGVEELVASLDAPRTATASLPVPGPEASAWADALVRDSVGGAHAVGADADSITDRLDEAFTHPVLGLAVFVAVMAGLFSTIFWLASVPMSLVEILFEKLGALVTRLVPDGAVSDLLVNGVIGGVAGTLVFLPQICLLFFLLSLLEDTGYLARAAFVMDRLMRRFGLPGQAFVPLLSSHACALPGIMSTRLIPDRNERLATILVAPFMSCTARLPVYVLLTGLLFAGSPLLAGVAFASCYLLGAAAAMLSALLARRTILKGSSRPMVLELPTYKWPSVRTALLTTLDRAVVFLRNAGTVIMAICVVMWWMSAYPRASIPPEAAALRAQAAQIERSSAEGAGAPGGSMAPDGSAAPAAPATTDEASPPGAPVASAGPIAPDAPSAPDAGALIVRAEAIEHRHQQLNSFAGKIGSAVQPIFAPLGADRQLTVAILTSFLAREVFVSTMSVLTGAGDDTNTQGVMDAMRNARRDDGTLLFDHATSASILIFYVLAMQCLPTLAVTRRETGSWKWAALQFLWMTGLAWIAAAAAHLLVQGWS